ncbi:adenylate cyclase associated N terminal-domain-containing protein [Durotheca rogersii]|uniref:adenylate cyclase associated N terminal-domain-containing protein n=1 Tax=Durotheca rogersii TaxID=419775 RepID=UPI00221EC0A0|nr:adenylate cyclase associated N terminal-domain-containing protein [Durotheca rogersii]KAI5866787.1 adenylate cyclase associated N terminal-domain-containing protein [Durotheca rogersii]
MAQNNIHNLVTLIKRLETATTRLEDIASSTIELPRAVPALSTTIPTPSSPTPHHHLPAPPPPAPKHAPQEPLPESIEEFDAFIHHAVDKYVKASNKLGGLIAEQASKVLEGFRQQRRFLLISTQAKKPDISGSEMVVYQELLKPINEALIAVGNIKESNRGVPVFSHLSAVADGIMVLAWVTVDNKPYTHVGESLGSAQFFGNRVLQEYKDKEPDQVEWVQAFYQVFRDLTVYVKQYFPGGIPWNPHGQSASEVAKTLESAAGPSVGAPPPPPPSAAGGAPPPPPPPGPPPVLQIKEQAASSKADGGFGAVFNELNKGESVTQSLRKVDRSEMTHKNPALRAGSTVSDSSARGKSPAPGKKPKPESMRVKKPPKKELDGNKWTIENFEKHAEPIEIEAEMTHSILISRCNQTTIIVKGKANAVTVENTQRLSLVVDSLVSTVDVVKSSNFALQVLGNLPTVLLDQLDGAQIYLSPESVSTRIFSSKSAGINVNVIARSADDDDEGDYKEIPLPGQICSYYDVEKGTMVNEIVEHAG